MKIVIDATTDSAAAVDAAGRSVGVANGQPIRYAPASKVEVIDGKLVMTIPTKDPGRISTVVRAPDGRSPVTIETRRRVEGCDDRAHRGDAHAGRERSCEGRRRHDDGGHPRPPRQRGEEAHDAEHRGSP